MKIHTYFLLALFVLLTSCSNSSSKSDNIEKIHFTKNNISLSDSFDIDFVKLETNDECLIGAISNIEVFDNRIFILDRRFTESLYVFDMNGKFISKIGSKGSGPGNYVFPIDFTIDKENRRVVIDDGNRNNLLFYDLDSYEYLYSKNHTTHFFDFLISKNQFFLFSPYGFDESRSDNYVLVTDSSLKPILKGWKCSFRTRNLSTINANFIYNCNNKIFVYHHLFPYIYEIAENECKLSKELSFEGFQFQSLDPHNNESSDDYLKKIDKSEIIIKAYAIFELNDILLIQLLHGYQFSFALYNKKTEESCIFNLKEYYYSLGLSALMYPINVSDDKIICSISSDQLPDMINTKNPTLAAIIEDMTEDDNPIICLINWKK